MLRSCIGPNQRNWVAKLLAIEFAINLSRSESMGYSPFFLNSGQLPRVMIWNNPSKDEYPNVRVYAERMKLALMAAHDALLTARVKQTTQANRRRRASPFVTGDLVYISTKNINLPRGTTRKLISKFIGPYRITEDFQNNSYRIELPSMLRQWGIHNVFHSSLLRIHVPNDDRSFPGRRETQLKGSHTDARFKVLWTLGDRSWIKFDEIKSSRALAEYFEAQGIKDVMGLWRMTNEDPSDDDPQVSLGHILMSPSYALNVSLYRRYK